MPPQGAVRLVPTLKSREQPSFSGRDVRHFRGLGFLSETVHSAPDKPWISGREIRVPEPCHKHRAGAPMPARPRLCDWPWAKPLASLCLSFPPEQWVGLELALHDGGGV